VKTIPARIPPHLLRDEAELLAAMHHVSPFDVSLLGERLSTCRAALAGLLALTGDEDDEAVRQAAWIAAELAMDGVPVAPPRSAPET